MGLRVAPGTSRTCLRVLDHDPLEDVRHVLGGVDCSLEAFEQVLPADHDHRVDPIVEQRCDRLARDPVSGREYLGQARHLLASYARGTGGAVRGYAAATSSPRRYVSPARNCSSSSWSIE